MTTPISRISTKTGLIPPRFGGRWTLVKLEAWKKYLAAYTSALKHQHFKLLCIDAFAGAGECAIGEVPWEDIHPGSAQIALETRPPFTEVVFIERDPKHCAGLQRLIDRTRPTPATRIINGDANDELVNICATTDWRRSRAVLFLDPFGMSVDWSTLERVAATGAIDVWYLFPLNGLCRQLARDLRAVDSGKRASITRVLGTDAWETELYETPRTNDLFAAEQTPERYKSPEDVAALVTSRLTSIFARVEDPKLLHLTKRGAKRPGAALFALYFAVSNRSDRARSLACKIARDVLTSV